MWFQKTPLEPGKVSWLFSTEQESQVHRPCKLTELVWKLTSSSAIKSVQLTGRGAVQDQMECLDHDLYLHINLLKYTSSWLKQGQNAESHSASGALLPQVFNNSVSAGSWFNTCPDAVAPSEGEEEVKTDCSAWLRGTIDRGKSICSWKDLLTTSFREKVTVSFLCFSEVWKVGFCFHQSSNSRRKSQRPDLRITKLRNIALILRHWTFTTVLWVPATFQVLLDTEHVQWTKEIKLPVFMSLTSRGEGPDTVPSGTVCLSGASCGWGSLPDAGEIKLN